MRRIDDQAVSRAYWEWLRTANPLLPPFHMVKGADMTELGEVAMTVHIVRPAEPFRFDPWEEAIKDTGIPADNRGWEKHLASALRSVASAMDGDEDAEYYRNCLAVAAANVRAMAPEGTEWGEPWSVHGWDASREGVPRSALRAVLRRLANADGRRPEGRELPDLKRAESYLHGLWLAAKEGGNG